MAKVRTPDPKRITKIIAGALSGDKNLANQIKDFLVGLIRSGTLPSGQRVKQLTETTKRIRRRLADKNKTHPEFSPNKSNLTFTGQFLDSFQAVIEKAGDGVKIRIKPSGVHKGITNLNGKRARGIQNEKLGEFLIEGGRDYRPVNQKNTAKIKKFVIKTLRKKLRL